jgi:hypothetical protein
MRLLVGDPIGYARVLGLVSFDCHIGSPFFSHRRRTLLLLVSVFSFRHHSLSLRRRPLPFRQQHSIALSPQKVTCSISLLRCPCRLVPFAVASWAHYETIEVIVRGYETINAVEWAMGYMDPQNPICVPRSRHEGRLSSVGTMGKKSVTLQPYAFQKAHFTVIQQLHIITPFSNEHKRQLREDNPDHGRAWLANMHMQGFNRWLQDYIETCSNNAVITDEIRNLAARPLFTITRYEAMDTRSAP